MIIFFVLQYAQKGRLWVDNTGCWPSMGALCGWRLRAPSFTVAATLSHSASCVSTMSWGWLKRLKSVHHIFAVTWFIFSNIPFDCNEPKWNLRIYENLLFPHVPLLFESDIEEKATIFSKDQTESVLKTNMSSFFSQPGSTVASETSGAIFTKFKEEPEDLTLLAPNPGECVVPLDFGNARTSS